MYRAITRALCFLLVLLGIVSPAIAKRVALVIGNSAYEQATPLKNPRNDADALAASLERLDFEVIKGVDLNRTQFEGTVRTFARAIRGADVALFFYAGHGLQVNGSNYLAPVDAKLGNEADLDFETLPLRTILKQMEREVKTNLVFLDACRDNPLARNLARSMGTRSTSVGRGLARVDSGVGTLIAFATEPGNVALDGAGNNSPFTESLLKYIETPNLDIARLMRRVRKEVLDKTLGKQVPWSNSSLTGDFMFASRQIAVETKVETKPKTATTPPTTNNDAIELSFWDSVKNSKDKEDFQLYLRRFPSGVFSKLAKRRIERLKSEVPSTVTERTFTTFESDVDRPGGDYTSLRLKTPDPLLCQARCAQDLSCLAWTYVKPGYQNKSAMCWLKNVVPKGIRRDVCCTSGVAYSRRSK